MTDEKIFDLIKRSFTPRLIQEKWSRDKAYSLYDLIDILVELDVLKKMKKKREEDI